MWFLGPLELQLAVKKPIYLTKKTEFEKSISGLLFKKFTLKLQNCAYSNVHECTVPRRVSWCSIIYIWSWLMFTPRVFTIFLQYFFKTKYSTVMKKSHFFNFGTSNINFKQLIKSINRIRAVIFSKFDDLKYVKQNQPKIRLCFLNMC